MKTLAFVFAMLPNGLWLQDEHVTECEAGQAELAAFMEEHGIGWIGIFCEYTLAPVTSPTPVGRPWK